MRDEDDREIDRLREHYARENTAECEHGHLSRQCNTCDLESDLAEARAEIERLKSGLALRDAEESREHWKKTAQNLSGRLEDTQQERDEARAEVERLKGGE